MELFLFRSADYERLYNCTGLNISAVPVQQRAGRFRVEAWASIVLCAIYYMLYIPCLWSIWRQHRTAAGSTCYTLLLYIAVLDLSLLWIPGFLHGWLSLQGAVFCSSPALIYISGSFVMCIWIAETFADLILALNRCLLTAAPSISEKLFGRGRTYFWIVGCSLYALYYLCFDKPVLFTSIYFAWFISPYAGYREDTKGEFGDPFLHSFHNSMVAIGTPCIYLVFAFVFAIKTRRLRMKQTMPMQSSRLQQQQNTNAEKMTFLQVFIISIMNTVCASIYMFMQHITPDQWLITVAQLAWLHIHGFPPVIYLALNRTIRDDTYYMLCRALGSLGLKIATANSVHTAAVVMVRSNNAWSVGGQPQQQQRNNVGGSGMPPVVGQLEFTQQQQQQQNA